MHWTTVDSDMSVTSSSLSHKVCRYTTIFTHTDRVGVVVVVVVGRRHVCS